MFFMKNTFLALVLLVFALISCNKKSEKANENTETKAVSFEIIRMDSLLFGQKNSPAVQPILAQHPAYFIPYFDTPSSKLAELSNKLEEYKTSPELLDFYNDTVHNKVNIGQLTTDLGLAFANIKKFDPAFRIPKVYYSFSGFAGKDLVVNDSTVVIGLEYFGGKGSKYIPQVYDYQLYKYQQGLLVPYIVNFIGAKYIRMNPADKSFVADALFYGKSFEFTQQMLPNTPDSLIIGIQGIRLAKTEASAGAIWDHVVSNKLLFEKSEFKKSKYLDERPSVPEIASECPGMVGRWLGWKIVKNYTKKTNIPLKDLLQNPNAQEIFTRSEYAGK
jgi:hypothetical protein